MCAQQHPPRTNGRFGKPAADYYVDDRMLSPATLHAWLASAGTEKGRKTA